MTSLVFLDVDGVLCTSSDHRRMDTTSLFVRPDLVQRLATIVSRCNRHFEAAAASDSSESDKGKTGESRTKVVLSTNWRFNEQLVAYLRVEIGKAMAAEGIQEDVVISMTPDLSHPAIIPTPLPGSNHRTRTDEILLWLRENALYSVAPTSEHNAAHTDPGVVRRDQWILENKLAVRNFVCLDDLNLAFQSCYRQKARMKEHFVMCDLKDGLTEELVEKAVSLLTADSFDFDAWARGVYVPCVMPGCHHKQEAKEKELKIKIKAASIRHKSMMEKRASRTNSIRNKPEKKRSSAFTDGDVMFQNRDGRTINTRTSSLGSKMGFIAKAQEIERMKLQDAGEVVREETDDESEDDDDRVAAHSETFTELAGYECVL